MFDVLAAWRQSFLSYYRWLDTGSAEAWTEWRAGRKDFEAAASRHTNRFGSDLDHPALDLTSASRAIAIADRAPMIRSVATALLVIVIALIAIGSPFARRWRMLTPVGTVRDVAGLMRIAVVAPWRLATATVDLRVASAVTVLALLIVGFLAGTVTGFTAPWVQGGSVLLIAVVAVAFESTADSPSERDGRGRLLIASIGPLFPGAIVSLALIAYAGPLGYWYLFLDLFDLSCRVRRDPRRDASVDSERDRRRARAPRVASRRCRLAHRRWCRSPRSDYPAARVAGRVAFAGSPAELCACD